MIDKEFAERFIEEISENSSYSFLVFNCKGIILAATEKEREGAFHEAAYSMMQNNKNMIIIENDNVKNYIGVKPGINVIVSHNHKMIGAIAMTGPPDEIYEIIMVAKMTFEKMFDYEILKNQALQNNDKREAFYGLLLAGEPENAEKLNKMAKHLDLSNNLLRVPILFTTTSNNENIVLSTIQKSEYFSQQDFVFVSRKQTLVVFKSINKSSSDLFKLYRKDLFKFINPICETLTEKNISYNYFVGSFQNSLNNYHFAYKHCLWLAERNLLRSFFYDYIDDYIQSIIPIQELNGIYHAIETMMDSKMRKDFFELFSVLKQYNYNLVESSESLNIHKNTLIFRLNKYKNYFNFNPIHDSEDRAFADFLCIYINLLF